MQTLFRGLGGFVQSILEQDKLQNSWIKKKWIKSIILCCFFKHADIQKPQKIVSSLDNVEKAFTPLQSGHVCQGAEIEFKVTNET